MFDSPPKLILGFVTGLLFGFLLQKGRVAKYPVILGQFLLRDWTVVKIMLTAVAVGSAGVYLLVSFGMAELHIRPAALGAIAWGGLLFGVGLSVLGYCPGTTVAACGEGHRDAMVGVAGMLTGAFAYVWLYPALQAPIHMLPDWGKVTIPVVTGTSPWLWVAGLLVSAVVSAYVLENMRQRWTGVKTGGPV